MTIPFRRWISFDRATLEGYYSGAGNTFVDWTERYQSLCKLGGRNPSSDPKNYYWHSVFRPRRGLGFESLAGMDQVVSVAWNVLIARQHRLTLSDTTRFDLVQGFVDNANAWHYLRATGKYYNGENVWDAYPPQQHPGYNNPQITIGALWMHEAVTCYMYSWKAGGGNGVEANRYMHDFFRGGSHFLLADYQPAFPADGKRCRILLNPHYMDVQYFNPVVNECRVNDVVQYWVPADTAVDLKLIGMGFSNDDDELDGEGDSRGGGWGDLVDVIEFWRQQDSLRGVWREDFDDELIDEVWTQRHVDANKTFVESGSVMTVGIDGVVAYLWYNGIHSPLLSRSLPTKAVGKDFTLTIKLNSYTIAAASFAGLFIGTNKYIDDKLWVKVENLATAPTAGETIRDANGEQGTVMADTWYEIGGGEGYFCLENKTTNLWHGFSWCSGSVGGANMFVGRNDGLLEHAHIWAFGMVRGGIGRRAVSVRRNNSYYDDDPPDANDYGPTLPVWLQIRIAGGVITFWYSTDGVSFTQYEDSGSPFSANLLDMEGYDEGLVVGLIGAGFGATTFEAPFEYFELNWGGTPYAILKEADGDFTVDTNLQITIPIGKFPPLPEGSYILRLIKEGMDFSPRDSDVDVWGWAGDWRCAAGGLVSEGERIVIESQVGPATRRPREQRGSIILIESDKQHKATLAVTAERWSEDDVRAPGKFYEGIVMESSAFRRGLDDKVGMFKISDMTLKLANHKKKFSTLLETYDFKNQLVRLYHAFVDEPESWKTHIVTMIAEDYNIEGTAFELILKDVSQKYFGVDVPSNVCIKGSGEGEFPNLHDDHIGLAMPEVLGLASLTEGEDKGAVEAIYVDTAAFKYLAAAGILHSVTEVYADNVLVSASNYAVRYEDGHTIIDFTGDQGDARITFNCTGYMYGGWNSAGGYIQNPAWILAYYLSNILSVPLFLLDGATFTALANVYTAMTEETSGKLILQEQKGSAEILRELCFSFGAKCWVTKSGSFAVGRKSLTGISSDTVLFEQTDLLGPVKRKMGMRDFLTHVDGHFNYFPAHNLFKGSQTATRDDLEERFRERREDRLAIRRRIREDRR